MPDPAPRRSVAAAHDAPSGVRMVANEEIAALVPPPVRALLERLWAAGHAAYVVGGSLRDALLAEAPGDWDVTTDARPERLQSLFPGSHYENRFGTVLVPTDAGDVVEITTFRRDHRYGDHRRPDDVTFGDDLLEDLSRRDFTVNALAWGRPTSAGAGVSLVDAFAGIDDLRHGVLRAVGDPRQRFEEDALRLVRAARLAGQLGFEVERRTFDAMSATAGLVRHVSRERIGQELRKMLRSREPSRGLRLMADTGILSGAIPELAEQMGVPQNKLPGMDCWEHTLATLDAATGLSAGDEILALAAIFHDAGKPRTMRDGHFFGHELVGAQIAGDVLRAMAIPREEVDAIAHLVRHHMFNYEPSWSDAAVRRLVQRVGRDAVDRLLMLREADNLGSGQRADEGHLVELRRRIADQQRRGFPSSISDLAVDGHDLQRELGLPPGPVVGALLARLLDAAIADPDRNTYRQSILDARAWLPELLGRTSEPAGDPRAAPHTPGHPA
jgi:tRNA nucleotidyltransferase (CCA-adding enzyme)